jgi:hypothetical protein
MFFVWSVSVYWHAWIFSICRNPTWPAWGEVTGEIVTVNGVWSSVTQLLAQLLPNLIAGIQNTALSEKQNPKANCNISMFRGCCTLQGVQGPVYTMTFTSVLLHKPTVFASLYLHFHGWYTWPTIVDDDFHDMVWWICTNNGHHLVKGITIFIKIVSRFLVFLWLVCTWQADKWLACGHTVSFVTSSGELWTQLWEGRHFGRCNWIWMFAT